MKSETQAILENYKQFRATLKADVVKAAGITTSSDLKFYDLENFVKELYATLTPMRDMFPRVKGKGGDSSHWKGVTAVNAQNVKPGVGEGNRNEYVTTTTVNYKASYATLNLDDFVSEEGELEAEGFDDMKALSVHGLLMALLQAEEKVILGGNANNLICAAAAGDLNISLTDNSADGGTIHGNVDQYVRVVPLTTEGWLASPRVAPCLSTAVLAKATTRTNCDASTDPIAGWNGVVTTTANITASSDGNNAHTISVSWDDVPGAAGYAVFTGPDATANCALWGCVPTNFCKISIPKGLSADLANNAAWATDKSVDNLEFDGLWPLIAVKGQSDPAAASGSYYKSVAAGNTGLTPDGKGGCDEIETALQYAWDNYRITYTDIWVAAPQLRAISKSAIAGGTAALFRFNVDASNKAAIENGIVAGGTSAKFYYNQYAAGLQGMVDGLIPIHLHPYMPAGAIMMTTSKLPYKMANIVNPIQVKTQREYMQVEYPQITRKYSYGCKVREVLQTYAPFSLALIRNLND